jgi:hypothetical protein
MPLSHPPVADPNPLFANTTPPAMDLSPPVGRLNRTPWSRETKAKNSKSTFTLRVRVRVRLPPDQCLILQPFSYSYALVPSHS